MAGNVALLDEMRILDCVRIFAIVIERRQKLHSDLMVLLATMECQGDLVIVASDTGDLTRAQSGLATLAH